MEVYLLIGFIIILLISLVFAIFFKKANDTTWYETFENLKKRQYEDLKECSIRKDEELSHRLYDEIDIRYYEPDKLPSDGKVTIDRLAVDSELFIDDLKFIIKEFILKERILTVVIKDAK